jgi:hypothetical protein
VAVEIRRGRLVLRTPPGRVIDFWRCRDDIELHVVVASLIDVNANHRRRLGVDGVAVAS